MWYRPRALSAAARTTLASFASLAWFVVMAGLAVSPMLIGLGIIVQTEIAFVLGFADTSAFIDGGGQVRRKPQQTERANGLVAKTSVQAMHPSHATN